MTRSMKHLFFGLIVFIYGTSGILRAEDVDPCPPRDARPASPLIPSALRHFLPPKTEELTAYCVKGSDTPPSTFFRLQFKVQRSRLRHQDRATATLLSTDPAGSLAPFHYDLSPTFTNG